jgi:hypothetical protein
MKKPVKTIAQYRNEQKTVAQLKAQQAEQSKKAANLALLYIPLLVSHLGEISRRMTLPGADLDDLKAKKAKTEEKLARFQQLAKDAGLLKGKK